MPLVVVLTASATTRHMAYRTCATSQDKRSSSDVLSLPGVTP